MLKKIKLFPILIFCSVLSLLFLQTPVIKFLSLLNVHTTDSAAFAQTYTGFTVSTASSTGTNPHAATDDNNYVYITYEEGSDSIDFRKSTDNGATFGDAVNVATGSGFFPRISIDNMEEAFVIYSFEKAPNFYPAGYKSVHPGGNYSFSLILDDNDVGAGGGALSIGQCDIAVENVSGTDNIYAVWEDNDTDPAGQWYIHFAGETDSDYLFDEPADAAINTNPDARYPAIAVKHAGVDDVYVAWVRVGNHIMFDYSENASLGAGMTWQGADIQISDTAGIVENQRPGLAASSSADAQVFAVWCVSSNGRDVLFDYSADGGTTWNTDVRIGSNGPIAYSQDQPSIAVKPGTTHLYAAWRDLRDGIYHIYFQEATWTGAAFRWGIDLDGDGTVETGDEEGIDLRVSETSVGSEETPTVIANQNGEVFVVYRDTGAGIMCARYALIVPPTGLTASAGDTRVNLSWTAPSSGTVYDYKIYRGTHSGGPYTYVASVAAGTTTYKDEGLTNKTKYCYVVTAVYDSADGRESGFSNEACATPGGITISRPTGLTAIGGVQQIALDWDDHGSIDFWYYKIYYSKTRGSWDNLLKDDDDKFTSSNITWLSPDLGVPYWFVVTAVDLDGNESLKSNDVCATARYTNIIDSTAPAAPTDLVAASEQSQISLSWTASISSDVVKHNVYYSLNVMGVAGTYYHVDSVYTAASPTVYIHTGLSETQTYYYVVSAIDTSGNESSVSNEVYGTPLPGAADAAPSPPATLTATAGDGRVDLNWSDNTENDFSSYTVYRGTIRGTYSSLATGVTVSQYADTSLTNGTCYWYVVTAIDTGGRKVLIQMMLMLLPMPVILLHLMHPKTLLQVRGIERRGYHGAGLLQLI